MTSMYDDDGDTEGLEEDDTTEAYDWELVARVLKTRTSSLNPYCMDFSPSTEQDKKIFKLPKDVGARHLYTASFLCKKRDDWFIYRVILPVDEVVDQSAVFSIFEFLTERALYTVLHHKRCKDPLVFLRDIRLPKDE